MKKWILFAILVIAIIIVFWLYSRPAMMPARHLREAPQAPGNEARSKFPSAEDQRDKLIKQQEDLIRLYELRIKELEEKIKEMEKL